MFRSFRIQFYLSTLLGLVWSVLLCLPNSRTQIARDLRFYPTSWRDNLPNTAEGRANRSDSLAMRSAVASPEQAVTLSEEYRENVALAAIALRRWFLRADRYDGPIYNVAWPAPVPTPAVGVGAPYSSDVSPRANWERYLKVAQHGQKLEPDNAYFDVMALQALFALRRDDQTEKLLHAAAQKRKFNPHYREELEMRLEARSLARGQTPRDLRPSDKLIQFWSQPLGDIAQIYRVVNWAEEKVIALRVRGQHSHALQVATDVMHLTETIRQTPSFVTFAESGIGMEHMAFWPCIHPPNSIAAGAIGVLRFPPRSAPVTVLRADSRSLAAYARAHGRVDIAREAEREWMVTEVWTKAIKRYSATHSPLPEPFNEKIVTLASVWDIPRHFVLLSLGPLVLLCLVATWISRRKNWESSDEWAKPVWLGSGLYVLLVFVLNLCDAFSAQYTSLIYSGYSSTSTPFEKWSLVLWWAGAAASEGVRYHLPGVLWCAPALLLIWLMARSAFPKPIQLTPVKPTLWTFRRKSWPRYEYKMAQFDPSPFINSVLHDLKVVFQWLLTRLLLWGSIAGLLWCVSISFLSFIPLVLFVVVGRWIVWRRLGGRSSRWPQALHTMRGSALGMLWAGTVLWFGLSVVEVPYRAQFDAEWNQLMAQGELNLARQEMHF